MSAICGLVTAANSPDLLTSCRTMLAGLEAYGPDEGSWKQHGDAAFGRALFRLVPEDDHDRQPLVGRRVLLAADLRIDNRDDIIHALGRDAPLRKLQQCSDADLLLACYERWGADLVHRIVGVFAFAIWDDAERRLLLARDPLGQRPLFYRNGGGGFAFATMPSGILALDPTGGAADAERIAEVLSDMQPSHDRSFFAGVRSVEPGHLLTFAGGEVRSRRYWNPQPRELRLGSMEAYVEAYREMLDEAVRCRLRGAGATVGAHLSSGYDSSAVAATAARLLDRSGGRVVAFTSAPRLGFEGLPARGRIADESDIAAVTASRFPNMDHVVLRPEAAPPLAAVKEMLPFAQQPIGNIKNAGWWSGINAEAARRGARVMLTGQVGNMTISAGGLNQLADMIREGQWLGWWREARRVVRKQNVRWRGVLAASWGPWVPTPLWRLILRAALSESKRQGTPFLLVSRWQEEMARRSPAEKFQIRPPRDTRAFRLQVLQRQNSGSSRKAALAQWGIDERDPTADTRLIDFTLSLPREMLLDDGVPRRLARAALGDRLPPEVLDAPLRGFQSADWYEQIGKADAAGFFELVKDSPSVAEVIDVNQIGAMIKAWPDRNWHLPSVFSDYWLVLNALSAAYFIRMAEFGAAQPARASGARPAGWMSNA